MYRQADKKSTEINSQEHQQKHWANKKELPSLGATEVKHQPISMNSKNELFLKTKEPQSPSRPPKQTLSHKATRCQIHPPLHSQNLFCSSPSRQPKTLPLQHISLELTLHSSLKNLNLSHSNLGKRPKAKSVMNLLKLP